MKIEHERYGPKADKNINGKSQIDTNPGKGSWRDNGKEVQPGKQRRPGIWIGED